MEVVVVVVVEVGKLGTIHLCDYSRLLITEEYLGVMHVCTRISSYKY